MSDILERLADVVESRKAGDPEKSYVSRLFARGPDAILKKVGEEATERSEEHTSELQSLTNLVCRLLLDV